MFERGDVATFRYVSPVAGIERAQPVWVVEDTTERTVLYIPAFSAYRQGTWVGNKAVEQFGTEYIDKRWRNYSMLRIMYAEVPYAVCPMWDANSGEFRRWYVNIESPVKRTSIGFDAIDYELDIVVQPDMSWDLKDVEELQKFVRMGVFSSAEAATFHGFGERAICQIEGSLPPFNEPWPDWKPDADWGPLDMPDGDSWLTEPTK